MIPFKPSLHGFPFPNWWPPGTPVIEIPTPFGKIPIGDAHGGVCGGMVFAAADFYHAGQSVPQTQDSSVLKYFCNRLLESWHLPFGVLKYYDWQRRPTASRWLWGLKTLVGTAYLTAIVEWPKIKAILDAGGLAPLGLVKPHSRDPRKLGQNHQVLAYSYVQSGDAVTLHIYDPNYPGDDSSALSFSIANPDGENLITHSCEGPTIRGLFLTDYQPREPGC